MKVFDKIKKARLELGLTQTQLAELLGFKPNEVSKLESGGKKFVPVEYFAFLHSRGYDINSIIVDELPLKRSEKEKNIVSEPDEDYLSEKDEIPINQIKSILDSPMKMLFVDFFKGFNEIKQLDKRTEKLELLMAKMLLKFGELEEALQGQKKSSKNVD